MARPVLEFTRWNTITNTRRIKIIPAVKLERCGILAIPFAPELNSANIIILNPVSGLLWERLQTECTIPQLVKAVTENFTIDAATAQCDIEEFLQTIKENDMLE